MFEIESVEVPLTLRPPFEGAEVVVRMDLSAAAYLTLRALTREAVQDEEWIENVYRGVGSVIVSWNLSRKGKPVPVTDAGFRSVPLPLLTAIALEWCEVLVRPSDPLSLPSTTGEPDEDLSPEP